MSCVVNIWMKMMYPSYLLTGKGENKEKCIRKRLETVLIY